MASAAGGRCRSRARQHAAAGQGSLFGHVKHDWPHLCRLREAVNLARELDAVRRQYNTVRLHAGIGYVTPDDEHEGRGPAIRRARREGLDRASVAHIAHRRHP